MNLRIFFLNSFLWCVFMLLIPLGGRAEYAYGQLNGAARSYGNIPDVPDPTCAGCGGRNGNHSRNCPYGGGGDSDSESTGPVDVTTAPIFVAPVGIIGGVFMGGGWYFGEMAGKYPKKRFLSSYSDYVSIKTDSERRDASFNFGSHIGALPWLALYLPTWPIRQGVVYVAKTVSAPPKRRPPDPRIAVYEAIALNYSKLREASGNELSKVNGDIQTAEMRRNLYLDDFISSRAELREFLKQNGIEAARAKAAKQLDAWSKNRAEKEKLALTISQSIREKDAICREALNKANGNSLFADFQLGKTETQVDALLLDKTLPQAVQDSLQRQKRVTGLLKNSKTVFDIAGNINEIRESVAKSRNDGQDLTQWLDKPEAMELLSRLNLKLLTATAKAEPYGLAAGGAETLIDASYAVTANIVYSGQIEAEQTALEKLRTANVFHDAAADDWDRLNLAAEAARERERVIRLRHDHYEKMQKENEKYAKKLR